jgi:aminopeptidase
MLMEMPANLMTPSIFSSKAQELLQGTEKTQVQVTIRDHAWAKEHNMNAFLAVSQGSQEPLKFVEIHYRGSPERDCIDLALVGKGVTYAVNQS